MHEVSGFLGEGREQVGERFAVAMPSGDTSLLQLTLAFDLAGTIDQAGWLVFLHHPEQETFHGRTLEEALAWCLVWLMAPEIGIGQFLV